MNLVDGAKFYYQTKYANKIQEREALEDEVMRDEAFLANVKDLQKNASGLKDMAINFARNHPKATENAVTGAIMGAGTELVMPSNRDPITGEGKTSLGDIAKRGIAGGLLGGIGGEVKTHVRSRLKPITKIAEIDAQAILEKAEMLKSAASFGGLGVKGEAKRRVVNFLNKSIANHPHLTLGTMGAGIGGTMGAGAGYLGYKAEEPFMTEREKKEAKPLSIGLSAGIGGMMGGASGLGAADKIPPHYKGVYDGVEESYQKARGFQDFVQKTKDTKQRLKTKALPAMGSSQHLDFTTDRLKQIFSKAKPNPGAGYGVVKKLKKGVELLSKVAEEKEAFSLAPISKGYQTGKAMLSKGMSSAMQTAGSLYEKNPTLGGAALGVGTGLAANALSGSDHPLGSALVMGGAGALAGKAMLPHLTDMKDPLLGHSFARGATSAHFDPGTLSHIPKANTSSLSTAKNVTHVPQSGGFSGGYDINTSNIPTPKPAVSDLRAKEIANAQSRKAVAGAYSPSRSSAAAPTNVASSARPSYSIDPSILEGLRKVAGLD